MTQAEDRSAQPYRPLHQAGAADIVDPAQRFHRLEPPFWRVSGTLMAAGVLLLLVAAGWLSSHYTQAGLR